MQWRQSAALAGSDAPAAQVTLAAGTRWETHCYASDSGQEGPTVLLVAGVHGNEPAGVMAAERMRRWRPLRGRLVLVPRANQPALARGTRRAPATRFADLNRNFPRTPDDAPRGTLARALWQLLTWMQPDWVIDLHEGFDFNRTNPDSVGSSVLYVPAGDSRSRAERLARAVNATVSEAARQFTLLRWPARGSLSRAAWEALAVPSMILETTRGGQPLELRAAQHELMVAELLDDLQMLPQGTRADAGAP